MHQATAYLSYGTFCVSGMLKKRRRTAEEIDLKKDSIKTRFKSLFWRPWITKWPET